ncbi:MAG TPA: PKD domain-containing protein, partial [Bacteroidetes bacterium]|nr:PKD domain-containing protein [Bacteroidota bacterium]
FSVLPNSQHIGGHEYFIITDLNGNYQETIQTPQGFRPCFIHELIDGRLITTCEWTGQIIIFNPIDGNIPPVCNINVLTPLPYIGPAPAIIDFDGSESYDQDGYIVSYSWDFGDQQTGTGETPTHAYYQSCIYTVELTVIDNEGLSSTCYVDVDITIQ